MAPNISENGMQERDEQTKKPKKNYANQLNSSAFRGRYSMSSLYGRRGHCVRCDEIGTGKFSISIQMI